MISMAGPADGRSARTLPPWWLMLITGIGWILVSVILLRFDYTSVSSISILFGFVALFAGAAEIGVVFMAAGWWKLLHARAGRSSSSSRASSRSSIRATRSSRWPRSSASS